MKTKNLLFLLLVTLVTVYTSCKKDKKLETLATVTTDVPTNITASAASISGKITSDGNSAITEAGFVYSNVVMEPTTADNKVQATNFDTFNAVLEGLNSGKTYRVRAYAINGKGTAYGELRTFETGNLAPVATNVKITGAMEVGKTLTASFTYTDAETDAIGITGYQWYVANDANGAGEMPIAGATNETYVVQDAQQGKFITIGVTPKALAGTLTGVEVKATYNTGIGAETVTFTYNGSSVTYGTIISSVTQKKWLDRNLGAARVAQTVDDYTAYGHLFQWGRSADGHQIINRTGKANGESVAVNGTTTTKSAAVTTSDNRFVAWDGVSLDWLATPNDNLWQGVNGVNNPCPAGWRIPTQEEWTAENITTLNDGFGKLKLTFTGYREAGDGEVYALTTLGGYWGSTVGVPDGTKQSIRFSLRAATASSGFGVRANGYACRCIKN